MGSGDATNETINAGAMILLDLRDLIYSCFLTPGR